MTANPTAGSRSSDAPTPVGAYIGSPAVRAEWDGRYADAIWLARRGWDVTALEVSAQYPALLRTSDAAAERALLSAVAPNGLLLLAHHAGMDTQHATDSGFDPADYVWPSMVAELLNDDWTIELYEERPRIAPDSGAGAHHAEDLILRARRLC